MTLKDSARYVVLGVLFCIPFIPLYVSGGLFFPFIAGKGFLFRILVEIGAAAYLILAVLDARYRPRFSLTLVLYAAFVGWMFIADSLAVNPHKAFWSNFERMDGWVTLIHLFLFFLMAGSVLTIDKLWRNWWLTFLGASAIVGVYGLLQLTGALAIHQSGVRVDATFGNSAYFAAYLLFMVAVSLWQAIESRGFLRYALLLLTAVHVVLVFETATRGAVLGLVGAAGAGSLLWMVDSGRRGRLVAGALFVVVVLSSLGFYSVRDSDFIQSSPTLSRVSSISAKDLSTRFTLWSMALEGVADRPLVGYGQEGFNYVFNTYYRPSLFAQEPWFDRAHNVFLDWMTAGGFPALLLFIGMLGSAVWALYRRGASKAERVLLTSALIAYGIQGLVVFDNLFSYVPLAAILACAHSVSSRPWKRLESLPEAKDETSKIMLVTAVVIVASFVVWSVNVPNILGASNLVRAMSERGSTPDTNLALFKAAIATDTFGMQEVREQLTMFTASLVNQSQGVTNEQKNEWAQFAFGEMQKEVAAAPGDARLRLQLALGYRSIGQNELALRESAAARELSPRKQGILIEQGLELSELGKNDEARTAFTAAYELDPSFNEPAAYAAAGAMLAGDSAAGRALLQSHFGTTTVDNDAVAIAYYKTQQYTELINLMRARLETRPGDAGVYTALVSAYAAAGRLEEARATIEEMRTKNPSTAPQAAALLQYLSSQQ